MAFFISLSLYPFDFNLEDNETHALWMSEKFWFILEALSKSINYVLLLYFWGQNEKDGIYSPVLDGLT